MSVWSGASSWSRATSTWCVAFGNARNAKRAITSSRRSSWSRAAAVSRTRLSMSSATRASVRATRPRTSPQSSAGRQAGTAGGGEAAPGAPVLGGPPGEDGGRERFLALEEVELLGRELVRVLGSHLDRGIVGPEALLPPGRGPGGGGGGWAGAPPPGGAETRGEAGGPCPRGGRTAAGWDPSRESSAHGLDPRPHPGPDPAAAPAGARADARDRRRRPAHR